MREPNSITDLIANARGGDVGALDQIFRAAYDDLHALATARMSNGGKKMLNTAALVHESYLRFVQMGSIKAEDRPHFLNYAGRVMRSVIVDLARERQGTLNTDLAEGLGAGEEQILKIDEALESLARQDERLVRVVEMRYFGGLTENEIAAALDVRAHNVRSDWEKARVMLAGTLGLQ
jgi:RNA polymerase sigma factor (TIGR02999 family)